MLTVHVALPTHPGAAAAAGILHSDVGWLMLAGIGVSVVVGIRAILSPGLSIGHYHLSINVLEQQQTAEVPISRLTRSRPVCRRRMRWLSVG